MICVYLANGFEEVEALTVVDFLRRCDGLQVLTVGVGARIVTGSHKIPVVTDIDSSEVDLSKLEMIVLPGGMPGTINLEKSPEVINAINYCYKNNKYIAAICAAPSILGHLGLLNGIKATCFYGFEDELFGASVTQEDVQISNNIITSRGAGTASKFAFALIELLCGKNRSQLLKESIIWKE
ncbi:MAG: DJ-1/PfpI family protein [Oscillospiraceae bacterium]